MTEVINDVEPLCDNYYYSPSKNQVLYKSPQENSEWKMIYADLPIKRGYREFMKNFKLASAMEKKGLFK